MQAPSPVYPRRVRADELVSDKEKFLELKNQCEQILDTGKRLPDFVFRRPFVRYYAVEYAHVYGRTFGGLLREMSNRFGDESASYMVLHPSPGDSYLRHSSFYGLISFSPATLPDRYLEVMSPTKGLSHILAGANLGVFWGCSLEWAVFADRISWELAVIATQKDIDVSRMLGWPCFNAEQVKSYMTSQYHRKDPSDTIASEFNTRFLANYSI